MESQLLLPITEVALEHYASLTGWSVATLRGRIKVGKWTEGIEYIKNSDGRIVVNIPLAQAWERQAWNEKAESVAPSRTSGANYISGFTGVIPKTHSKNIGGRSRHIKPRPKQTGNY